MLWIKAFHVIFMVTWFAGLFYLPRLFVYHAMSDDLVSRERFQVMEHKLFWGIMTPSAIATALLGLWMILQNLSYYASSGWLHAKLVIVGTLILYHIWCGKLLNEFKRNRNTHSHVWYRWFNEVPVVFLVTIVILAVVKPF
jgi:protoporphyrinogen IX oxidase